MTIKEAINEAKKQFDWSIVLHKPSSVKVKYVNIHKDIADEIVFDLYTDNLENELETLWSSLCGEIESSEESVLSVKAFGYITD